MILGTDSQISLHMFVYQINQYAAYNANSSFIKDLWPTSMNSVKYYIYTVH